MDRLFFEASADGVRYEMLGSASDLVGLETVELWFGITAGPTAPALTAHFASFNDPD